MDPKWNEPAVGFEPTPADYNQLLYQLSYAGISTGKILSVRADPIVTVLLKCILSKI
jgi:hypothetical protein